MKKIVTLLVALTLTCILLTSVAYATEGDIIPPEDLFTWQLLATYGGAIVATALITQFFKGIGPIDRIPTRIFAYVVALILTLAATYFTGAFTAETAVLCLINAFAIAIAASGGYDLTKQLVTHKTFHTNK